MSTYNSKFSGAEIDELLEKVASGQVGGGGGGSSGKEEFAKETGLTHKHTITLNAGSMGILRCVMYNDNATQCTVETLAGAIANTSFLNAYGLAKTPDGGGVVVDCKFAVDEEGELVIAMGGTIKQTMAVESVDFTNQTTSGTGLRVNQYDLIPVSLVIQHYGATFTDDVTEL